MSWSGGRREACMLVDWEYAGHGPPAVRPRQPGGQLRVRGARPSGGCWRAYFGEPPAPWQPAALTLMRIVSDAREAAWGVVQGVDLRARLRLRRLRATALRAARARPRRRLRTRGAALEWRGRASCPTARADRDHRRRRRRRGDRLPPGAARRARRDPARPQRADQRLDVSLGRASRAAARRASR